jgi:hypothetical protein
MLFCEKNKLWLEHLPNLVCSFNIVPLEGNTLEQQMNALSRLVIIISIVLFLFGSKFSFLFLLLALLFIIILYYIQRNTMKEGFTVRNKNTERNGSKYHRETYSTPNTHRDKFPTIKSMHQERPRMVNRNGELVYENPTSKTYCNDFVSLDGPNGAFNNPNWMSVNQKLVGHANPKTHIAPIVTPPPADLTYWRANNMVIHSAINDESQTDVYRSGYQVSSCCPTSNLASYTTDSINEEYPMYENNGTNTHEGFEMPYLKKEESTNDMKYIRPNQTGQLNLACGYNPEQLYQSGLPTNLPVGNCNQHPNLKQYNTNLFTQTIQPNVYTRSEINEPINSNIGISFTQQLPPVTSKFDTETGVLQYTEHDPRIIEPAKIQVQKQNETTTVKPEDVYDPRFTGYGTSYRAYTDNNLGQTKFYYDDINSIRMPNYIVRSNIDHHSFADSYGPISEGNGSGNKHNADIRELVHDAYTNAMLQHRTDIQMRQMRKINNQMWQRRVAPIHTSNMRMAGAMNM